MGPQILKKLYSCTIESIQTGFIPAWYVNNKLPAIQDLYTRRCQRKALKIVKDSTLVTDCSLCYCRSKILLNSFYPQAIRLLNS